MLVIEDVVTTGGQLVLSTQDLRAEGAVVEDALCVIDREGGGADVAAGEELRRGGHHSDNDCQKHRCAR